MGTEAVFGFFYWKGWSYTCGSTRERSAWGSAMKMWWGERPKLLKPNNGTLQNGEHFKRKLWGPVRSDGITRKKCTRIHTNRNFQKTCGGEGRGFEGPCNLTNLIKVFLKNVRVSSKPSHFKKTFLKFVKLQSPSNTHLFPLQVIGKFLVR